MEEQTQNANPQRAVVRPGRVDDLALAVIDRFVAPRLNPEAREFLGEVRPTVEALCRRHLGKIQIPGLTDSVKRNPRRRENRRGNH